MGGQDHERERDQAVYRVARDYRLDKDYFWFGWTDVLPEGTHMLVPAACAPGGETTVAVVRTALRELGKGRTP